MQFYIANDGEKRGPFPIYRVIDQLRAGEVSPDALGWEAGMSSWQKLREIPAFSEVIELIENPPEPAANEEDSEDADSFEPSAKSPSHSPPPIPDPRAAKPSKSGKPVGTTIAGPLSGRRPFARFMARAYDYMLISTIAFLFADIPPMPVGDDGITDFAEMQAYLENYLQNPEQLDWLRLQYTAIFLWHAIEGILLALFGTTPGKLIFGIRVLGPGDTPRLTVLKGISRAFLVWAAGAGLALFPFYLVGCGVALYMLLTQGTTIWDRVIGSRVEHRPMTPQRILIAIGGFLLLMILPSFKFS